MLGVAVCLGIRFAPLANLPNALGWNKVQKKTGIVAEYYIECGVSTNNNIQKGDPSTGNAAYSGDGNGAVATPSDADMLTLEQIEQFLHRNDKSNIVSGITPTPVPMYKHSDWGFLSDTVHGRSLRNYALPIAILRRAFAASAVQ